MNTHTHTHQKENVICEALLFWKIYFSIPVRRRRVVAHIVGKSWNSQLWHHSQMHCHLQTSTTLLHSWLWQWWDVTENEMRWVMDKYFRQIYFLQTPLISRGVKIGCTAFAISDQALLISKAFEIYSAFFFFFTQQSSTNSHTLTHKETSTLVWTQLKRISKQRELLDLLIGACIHPNWKEPLGKASVNFAFRPVGLLIRQHRTSFHYLLFKAGLAETYSWVLTQSSIQQAITWQITVALIFDLVHTLTTQAFSQFVHVLMAGKTLF